MKEMRKTQEIILLLLIILLGIFITYIPHLEYPFPLHVDEWHHIALAEEIAKTGSFLQYYPYTGKPATHDLEIGYHMLLAGIQALTGLGIRMFILTGLFTIASILSVFTLARRWGEDIALLSALFVAIIPSTLAIGGPVFLIPVNLSLIFIPIGLKLAFDAKSAKHYLGLFSVCLFLLLSHPPSAAALLLVLSVYLTLNFKNKGRQLFLTLLLSILIALPNYLPYIQEKGIQSAVFSSHITLGGIAQLFGYISTFFLLVGTYFISRTRDPERWSMLIAVFLLFINMLIFIRTGFNPLIPYIRIFLPTMLLMSIVSAHGISKLKLKPLIVLTVILIVGLSIKQHLDQPYYHVIGSQEYQDFLWIKGNTPEDAKVLLDPWKARALTPVAERQVLSVTPFGPVEKIDKFNDEIRGFLLSNCTDISFLKRHGISLIYSEWCDSKDLIKAKDRIYFVSD